MYLLVLIEFFHKIVWSYHRQFFHKIVRTYHRQLKIQHIGNCLLILQNHKYSYPCYPMVCLITLIIKTAFCTIWLAFSLKIWTTFCYISLNVKKVQKFSENYLQNLFFWLAFRQYFAVFNFLPTNTETTLYRFYCCKFKENLQIWKNEWY